MLDSAASPAGHGAEAKAQTEGIVRDFVDGRMGE